MSPIQEIREYKSLWIVRRNCGVHCFFCVMYNTYIVPCGTRIFVVVVLYSINIRSPWDQEY
ncbi:MAG: hypothetical protein ACM31E_02455, partial [Fibrobacterota bacterium]